ncbi:MAG: hypothetical protein R6U21_07705 [Thermoplasmatota archaeon]
MDVIPIIHLKHQILFKKKETASVRALLDKHSLSSVYLYDEQGILKNHPQVDFYQKLSKVYELWVDAGPREVGDIVDIVFSGAKKIVLRPSSWVETDVKTIRDLTDHQLFCHYDIDVTQREENMRYPLPDYDFDGIIVFVHGDWKKRRFATEEKIKNLAKKNHAFVYTSDYQDQSFWKSVGFKGILVDIDHFPEVIS